MNRLALCLPWLLLSACGERTFYQVEVQTRLVDEDGEPVMEQAYNMCGGAVFADDIHVAGTCRGAVTDRQGLGTASFSFTQLEELTDVQPTVSVEGTELDGEVLTIDQSPDPELEVGVDVSVTAQFTAPRAILPQKVTRFDLVGSVFGDREDGINDKTGTITAEVSLDEGQTVLFAGSASLTTDNTGLYATEVDVISNFDFPVSYETVTFRVDIDGYQGRNIDLDISDVQTGDPRVVDAFMSF